MTKSIEKSRTLQAQVLDRDNHECKTCCSNKSLKIHCRNLEDPSSRKLEDFITLCEECYDAIADSIKRKEYSKKKIVLDDYKSTTPRRVFE